MGVEPSNDTSPIWQSLPKPVITSFLLPNRGTLNLEGMMGVEPTLGILEKPAWPICYMPLVHLLPETEN